MTGTHLRQASRVTLVGLVVTLAALAAVLALVAWRYGEPPPKPIDAPPGEFSAGRASTTLRELVGDGVPHPVGSEANERVRERVFREFVRVGYAPEYQHSFVCGTYGACGAVHNVIARLDGRQPGTAVLIAAHYDSVGAGPGAADDGIGVSAVVEIARILKRAPRPLHSVIFLIADAEESGLLGARGFANSHPWAGEVRAMVNLDARGSAGPSLMFETSQDNAWLIGLFRASVQRPVTSSAFHTVYENLSNDTDFSVFNARRVQGVNFAFIRDAIHYHTPLDNFERASTGSLQHHGDNALAMLRALANAADLEHHVTGNAIWFDVFATCLISFPERSSIFFAVIALALVLFTVTRLLRRHALTHRALRVGLLTFPAMLVVSAVFGIALTSLLRVAGALPAPWIARTGPVLAAACALGFVLVAGIALGVSKHSSVWGLWAGAWLWWTLIGIALAAIAPGFSFLTLIPSLAAGMAGLGGAFARERDEPRAVIAAAVPAIVAACLWFPTIWLLYDAAGMVLLPAYTAEVALFSTTMAPLVATAHGSVRRFIVWTPAATIVVATLAALVVKPYSERDPQRVDITFHQDDGSGTARWIVDTSFGGHSWGPIPEPMRHAGFRNARMLPGFPWARAPRLVATADTVDAPAPTITVLGESLDGAGRRVRARVTSPRGAYRASIFVPGATLVEYAAIEGHPIPLSRERTVSRNNGWQIFTCLTLPPGGAVFEFIFAGTARVDAIVQDQSPGLPASGAALLRARPRTAVPFQDGDVSVFSRPAPL